MKMLRSLAIAFALTALAAACASTRGPAPSASPSLIEPDTVPDTNEPLLDHRDVGGPTSVPGAHESP